MMKRKMHKKITVLAAVLLSLGLVACGNSESGTVNESAEVDESASIEESAAEEESATEDESAAMGESAAADESAAVNEGTSVVENNGEADSTSGSARETGNNDVLVVYFSNTGNTKAVAQKIAGITGADTYEIKAAVEYTDADLNWNDDNSRTTKEQNDPSVRPEIGSEKISLDGYKTIYIGYPIWWGEEPRIMDTFVESYEFDGITMIPFCTSGSSGIGRSGQNLADNAGSGNWLPGERFSAGASEDDIKSWIEGLK